MMCKARIVGAFLVALLSCVNGNSPLGGHFRHSLLGLEARELMHLGDVPAKLHLKPEDVSASVHLFTHIDEDKDGKLSEGEFHAWAELSKDPKLGQVAVAVFHDFAPDGRMQEGQFLRFMAVFLSEDYALEQQELDELPPKVHAERTELMKLFIVLDVDASSSVTYAELQDTPKSHLLSDLRSTSVPVSKRLSTDLEVQRALQNFYLYAGKDGALDFVAFSRLLTDSNRPVKCLSTSQTTGWSLLAGLVLAMQQC